MAAHQSTKELDEKATQKLSSLLTSISPATASKQFEIGKVESFDFKTLGDSPVTFAKVSIRTRESLLTSAIDQFARDDIYQLLLAARHPSSQLFTSVSWTVDLPCHRSIGLRGF